MLDALPKVKGQEGNLGIGNDLNRLLNLTDKLAQQRGDQFIASELFVLAASDDKGELGKALRNRRDKPVLEAAIDQLRGGERCRTRTPRSIARRWRSTPSTSPARRRRQARSGHRPRRGDPPRHPGAAASHQEQSGADRRTRRRQDRHRRRPGATHHP
jgi:hypothetical protein